MKFFILFLFKNNEPELLPTKLKWALLITPIKRLVLFNIIKQLFQIQLAKTTFENVFLTFGTYNRRPSSSAAPLSP